MFATVHRQVTANQASRIIIQILEILTFSSSDGNHLTPPGSNLNHRYR